MENGLSRVVLARPRLWTLTHGARTLVLASGAARARYPHRCVANVLTGVVHATSFRAAGITTT